MSVKEIGGYFEIEPRVETFGQEYHQRAIALNTARNALAYLIRARKIKKLYIPLYLCSSVKGVCQREKCKCEFYRINDSFLPIFDKTLEDGEYLYVVNYFGLIADDNINCLREKFNNIILDNVQAFFKKPAPDIDCIYSCRKFFGVPDGAYLYTDAVFEEGFGKDDSSNRMSHLIGRKRDGASAHYKEFKDNDKRFVELPVMYMSDITHDILRHIDYKKAKERRESNFSFLHNELKNVNALAISEKNVTGPYCYPLLLKNGNTVKKELINSKIYVPTLWPDVDAEDNSIEQVFVQNVLPIPCDQRYDLSEMRIIVDIIKEFYDEY